MAKPTSRRNRKHKKDFQNKVKSLAGRLILFFVIFLVVLWLGLQAFNFCVFHAIRTADAQMGELVITTDARGALLFQEEVISAPVSGKLEPLVTEGMRVSIGTVVARMEPLTGPDGKKGSMEINSPSTGIVCYHLDGWEGVYDRLSWESSDPSVLFQNLTKESKPDDEVSQKEEFNRGDPVCKIIDNLVNPYLIIRFDSLNCPQVKNGERLQLTWEKEGKGEGRVLSLINKEENKYAFIELERMRPFPCQHLLELEVRCKKGEGIIIPESALISENNQSGVYVMSVLGPVFKKVDVVAAQNGQAAVQGISPGAEVVKNPGLAKLIKKDG
ncbi:HlyD family efflux transporter periplasmic adaptor subunit [Syntrophaceticus schinkii]|uniref:RND related barrel-sandwich hybrid domain-containing protein n=1 Tax=Syntrophaceticus schinkii TaxID=499207 RepID=A0A0B7MIL0_9FIRM|nr:HlyD family efflux transporter periplasmic adaptor subunit [Syntrophaceticus schinkii]MDD4674697.1 HlyD family efflux transporter periplasmic adaptor subunit [Syntrophaceticus schinkii]CEO87487.1 exported hypothetical protein [Syntrophaceticus schinkii]